MKKFIFLILMVAGLLNFVSGQTITTISNGYTGDWGLGSTWTGGSVPTAINDVSIGQNCVITINVADSFKISDLWLGNNCTIKIDGILVMDSLHINNNATLDVTGQVYILGGASLANNTSLTVNNTGSVDITGSVTTGTSGSQLIVDGNLSIGGNLTGNAYVDGTGSVSVQGSIGSGITQSSTVTLPIHLVSFNAVKDQEDINLYWTTASEENNDYFTIERSTDGKYYEAIGTVKGAGNSNINLKYSYIDQYPSNGISYYRLSQTDYDGKSETFSPISVSSVREADIKIGPNPVVDYLDISIGASSDSCTLNIYNILGVSVLNLTLTSSFTTVDVSELPKGQYFVVIGTNETNITKKIIVE